VSIHYDLCERSLIYSEAGGVHMDIIIAIICVFGAAATIMLVSTLGLGIWLKAAIIVPVVFLAVYSMARIQPKEPEAK